MSKPHPILAFGVGGTLAGLVGLAIQTYYINQPKAAYALVCQSHDDGTLYVRHWGARSITYNHATWVMTYADAPSPQRYQQFPGETCYQESIDESEIH